MPYLFFSRTVLQLNPIFTGKQDDNKNFLITVKDLERSNEVRKDKRVVKLLWKKTD